MPVLVVGRARAASDFAIACQHGGRDCIWIHPSAHPDLGLDEAKRLLTTQVREHGVGAVVDGTAPFGEEVFAEASYQVARTEQLPIVRAAARVFAEPPSGRAWVWVESLDEISAQLRRLGLRQVVVDVGPAFTADEIDRAVIVQSRKLDQLSNASGESLSTHGAVTVEQAVAALRDVHVDGFLVADRGDRLTHTLLAAAARLNLFVIAVRPRRHFPSRSGISQTNTAQDARGLFQWLRTIERGRPRDAPTGHGGSSDEDWLPG